MIYHPSRSHPLLRETISKETLRIDEKIRAREVRVVSANNAQLGVMLLWDTLQMTAEQQLDLVEVAPNALR